MIICPACRTRYPRTSERCPNHAAHNVLVIVHDLEPLIRKLWAVHLTTRRVKQ